MTLTNIARIVAIGALLAPSGAALAQCAGCTNPGITPPNYAFLMSGKGNLVKGGNNIWPCLWTFKAQSGVSTGGTPARATGGTITGGTASAPLSNCSWMTMGPATFTILTGNATGGTGRFNNLTFYQNGAYFCSGNPTFTFNNNGTDPSHIIFDSAAFGDCVFTADLTMAADLDVVY